ncbi:TetR/AcrR family transcriptional regulator [Bacillus thuringiensis]|uniref:TetR/AcrR family transcriptional regulator n=1 Tax=Bacillus thuringiensis TaxID=1428 RepID=UPI003985F4D0
MVQNRVSTADKILFSAIELMEKKGYNAITMKDIAEEAGISEMTVFRYFKSKNNLLETALKRSSYELPMQDVFENKLNWDLEHDLFIIAKTYHRYMKQTKVLILVSIEVRDTMPEYLKHSAEGPKQFKKHLTEYFIKMQNKQKINAINAEILADIFLTMNFGYYISSDISKSNILTTSEEDFIENSIQMFTRNLKQ